MSQISQISTTLKRLLKEHHITYKDIAGALSMSEANIKRVFSTESFTLARLEQICGLIPMTLSDLFIVAEKQQQQTVQLNMAQETELVSDMKLFLVATCVRDSWTFEEILEYYHLDYVECIRLFAKLDKLKIIQLLPNNAYKLLIAQDFRWIPNGPLERFMTQEVIGQFMRSSFSGPNNFRFYLRGTYSQASIDVIKQKLSTLTKEVALLNQEDAKLPLENRRHLGLLFAMRPWELSQFAMLRKK